MEILYRIDDDKTAIPCPSCHTLMETIAVDIYLTTVDPPIIIDSQQFEWIPGLGQFNVSPSLISWATEGMGKVHARCIHCNEVTIDLKFTTNPPGFVFGDSTRMEGLL